MIAARALQVKAVIPFQFVALPSEILRRVDVSDAAKLLVAVILDAARGSRSVCRLTNAALAARLGKSVAAVKRPLAELESLGLIRRDTLAGGRVRTGIVPTWVAQAVATVHAPGPPTGATPCTPGSTPGTSRSTIQTLTSEPAFQTGPISWTPGRRRNQDQRRTKWRRPYGTWSRASMVT